jgi:aarF domain-containing kinase
LKYSTSIFKKHPKKSIFLGTTFVGISYTLINPPPELLGLNHFIKSSLVVFTILLDYKFSKNNTEEDLSKIHQRSADRLLNLFFSNRGIFIKVGQHIAALNNIIPPEYTETMKKCQDQSISDSFENIKRLVESELRDKIENM